MNISNEYLKIIKEVNKFMKPNVVYVTGGFVRDYLLGLEPKDIDFSTPASPEEIEKKIKESLNEHGHNRRVVNVGKKFGCLKCKVFGKEIDIVTFRTEGYEEGNRKPKVKYVKNLHEDLSRRDFSINSMCIKLTKNGLKVIDSFGGKDDLQRGLIRAVGHPKQRFEEDPLRMLRAIRFACRFDFKIEDNTFEKIQKKAIYILNISKERWMMELDKILLSDNVGRGLSLLWTSNLFRFMIPELHLQFGYKQNSQYHNFNLDTHTINVVMATPKDINLRWAGLLHDSMKPFVRTENKKGHSNYIGHELLGAELVDKYAKYLKWSKERHKAVRDLVINHLNDDCPLRQYDNLGKK